LADSVIEEIKRMIIGGELKEGDKLPNQYEFAAQLGVSRPSLREALHTLSLIGAIEQRPGLGTIILSTNTRLWDEQLSIPLVSDVQASLELIIARRFIESGIAELAVQNATADDIRQIGNLLKKMIKALKKERIKEYYKLDMEFHHQIAISSHNRFMLHMFITIDKLIEQFIRETFTVIPGLLQSSLGYHKRLYEGIKERDLNKTVNTMREHIKDVEQSLMAYYAKNPMRTRGR
jgi:GntR family transcriptional repressor for pyruvate dehydrogenase complex